MRRKLAPVLALCALVTSPSVSRAQNGPDADPDAAPGYTASVFHHAEVDSINLYNGALTVPIALGPSYPVGPRLRHQLTLVYNSRVWEFGNPGPDDQSDVGLYQPIRADPSLGVGWSLSVGAIKPCGVVQNSQCYAGPDGAEHLFDDQFATGYYKSSDAATLMLHDLGAAGYEMWDGDGNHYVFAWHVTGYDDPPQGFLNDLGYGRNGWYLTSLNDPFGNSISATYYTNLGAQPCWTPAHCPTATNSWILKSVKRGSTTLATVNLGADAGVPGVGNLVTAIDFAVAGGATARWTLSHGTTNVTRGEPNPPSLNLATIATVSLPVSGQFAFTWNAGGAGSGYGGLLKTMTLPTGGVVSYVWGGYAFYHGRTASVSINCAPLGPPNNAEVKQSGRPAAGIKTNGPEDPEPWEPAISGNDCGPQNPNRWLDTVKGVARRTETVNGVDSVTDYAQWAFPFGEQGTVSNNLGPQTLTLVTGPLDVDGHRNSVGTLFWGALAGSPSGGGVPGSRIGADIRTARYDGDPYPGVILPFPQPLCGSSADGLCVTHAVRVAQRTFEYGSIGVPRNRRLQSETTYYDNTNADGSCPGCAFHAVAFSNSGSNTWESNGRHYNLEFHSGNLGGDARSVTTIWAPENWTIPPGSGETVLANLVNQTTEAQGSSSVDRYFEYDTGNGFLKGSFVYDAGRDIAFLNCRYAGAAGTLDKDFTKTFASSSTPARTYCSNNYPGFPGSVGQDSDTFGKVYTHQNGELLTARWINGSTATATFKIKDLTRDAVTGWIAMARDSAGLGTSYGYDGLGRVTVIDPPADLSTFVCYEGPNATTAYRASAPQTCPVSSSNPSISTWEHYDYDGLGRGIRERRLLPGGSVSKRFTLYDGAGHSSFVSEWVADTTSESVAKDLGTTCAFVSNPAFASARPSAAPGTFRMCFDPLGRPQQIVGAKHSSLQTVDRSDGSSPYSDVLEKVKTYCVNATFASLAQATCNTGGLNPETMTRKDAFGRVTKVTEPSNEDTTYAYDVRGKPTSVSQGVQSRTYAYDAAGFLRSETTPEQGSTTYGPIGSLGNVRQETQPDGLVRARTYDFAGRLTKETAGGNVYTVQCYDGASTCADGSPGYSGGSFPAGRLTRRYGYNWIPTMGPVVDDQFDYSDSAGRLSRQVTTAGNGDFAAAATQSWTYDGLGLIATHSHPRTSGSFPVTQTYSRGLPATIAGNGQTVVASTTWNPASGLASWKAGNSGTPVTTTIVQDASLLPRPGSISSPLWSSGTYTYDSTGNVLKVGATEAFGYDARSRLTSATYSGANRTYAYDRWGNLTRNGATTYTVASSSNRIVSGGAGYDGRGDMTAFGGESMAYDSLSRQYRNSNASADWAYLFDGAGERVVKFPAKSPVLRREMARYIAEANVLAKGWSLPACSGAFRDFDCNDPDARHIQLVYDKGVTAGCSANPLKFCPDDMLTRAQMAVFVVKGYKPGGFTPPACQGIFTDVPCGGAYATSAPWIEQMWRDGVTGGCSASPLQFCPGNTVGEWEILVWLAKAPGSTPGSLFWSAYHPVPRGSLYTWRDEKNRVVTEASGGSTGAATATLTVGRDNVFLGNLLVASYVASPAGWQYTVSDHLGNPRAVFNQSGQLVESHKFWPYGEDTNAIPPAQRLTYCLMERDTESTRHYDHARTHDYNLGRFLSPDKVGGHPRNPQSWNRYAYALGNPLKHIDPDGNVVANFTGLGNSPASGVHLLAKYLGAHSSLGTSRVFRHQDTQAAMVYVLKEHLNHPDQPVVVSGHSRGAASALTLTRLLAERGVAVNLLLTIDPVLADYRFNQRVPNNVRLAVNYYESEPKLEGGYVTGDPSATEIENRRVAGVSHGEIDDYVASSTRALESLIARVLEQLEKERRDRKHSGCPEPDKGCTQQ